MPPRQPNERNPTERTIVLVLILLGSILAAYAFVKLDPIRNYLGDDGKITLHGTIDGSLLNYLLHGPAQSPPTRLVLVHDPHPTAAYSVERLPEDRGLVHPSQRPMPVDFVSGANLFLTNLKDGLVEVLELPLRLLFGFISSDASAACTGGACFWIGGTGNFSDTTHWSLTTGGATCVCTPGSTDSVTFDASSGAGTATQNNATFTSGAVVMNNSSVTVAGSTNTWLVGGNWTDTTHFTAGTSTVQFTTNASVQEFLDFYKLTINISTTLTGGIAVGGSSGGGILTINGTMNMNNSTTDVHVGSSQANPLIIGGSGAITNGTFRIFGETGGTYSVNVPGFTSSAGFTASQIGNGTLTFLQTSALSVNDFQIGASGAATAGSVTWDTQGFSVISSSTGGIQLDNCGGSCFSVFKANASTITTNAIQVIYASSYMVLGSSTWTVLGSASSPGWVNTSTSASWSAGTSTVILKYNSSRTLTPGNLSVNEFNILTFDSAATGSTSITYTLGTRTLKWGGAMTVQQTGASSGTTTLATSNLGLTGGSLTVGNKAILTANASTVAVSGVTMTGGTSGTITLTTGAWTVSGNWNTSGAGSTFTKGTSTVTLAASGTLITGDPAHFYNLTINLGTTSTVTGTLSVDNVFTLNGTITDSGNSITKYIVLSDSIGGTDPFVRGASGTFTTSGNLGLDFANSNTASTLINVPGFTSVNLPIKFENNAAVTGSGTEYRLAANISAFTITMVSNANKHFFNSQTFNVTLSGPFNQATTISAQVGIQSTSGTWDIGGFGVDITFWWKMGSINATVRNQSWGGNERSDFNGNNWDAGTSTFTFLASQASPGNFCAAGGDIFHLTQAEFYNLIFDSSTTSTWNMASSADCSGHLKYANSLIIRNTAAGTTTLTTNGFSITGGAFTIAAGGTLSASVSAFSLSGNWDSSSTTATFSAGTSTVTLSGTSKTVALRNSSNSFYNLTASGSITASSTVWTSNTLLVTGTLTKTGQSLVFLTLTASTGTIVDGAISATKFSVSNSASNLTTLSAITIWTADTQYKWTDTFAAGTDTFTITGSTHIRFNVLKNSAPFLTGAAVVGGTISFTMLSGDPDVEVDPINSVTCATYYWVGGTGNWSDNLNHWANSSGGALPCDAYPNSSAADVVFDGASGSGTATLDVNPTTGAVTISGAVTLSAGTHTVVVNGNWDSSTGTISVASSTMTFSGTTRTLKLSALQTLGTVSITGTVTAQSQISASTFTISSGSFTTGTNNLTLTGGGTLTLSGGFLSQTSGSVSVGAVFVTVAAAYIVFGSTAWTVSGGWTNSSTSASWNAGTSTVTFTAAAGGTMVFAGSNLTASEFYNATFLSSGAGASVFMLSSRGMKVGHTLTLSDSSGTTALDVSTSNFALSFVNLSATNGGILNLHGLNLTVTGNWTDTSTTAWPAWTGSLTLSGTNQTVDPVHAFNDLTLSGGGTKTFSDSFSAKNVTLAAGTTWAISPGVTYTLAPGSVLTVHGTLAWNGTSSQHVVLTSTGTWTLDLSGSSATLAYVDIKNGTLINGTVTDCSGSDLGGNNGSWVIGQSSCDIANAVPSDLGPDLLAVMAMLTTVILIGGIISIVSIAFGKIREKVEKEGKP